jgi:anti-anti-sigma regulatory factor
MAGYHSFELAYLAAVYTNLLITKEPMDFYFKPTAGAFGDNILRVQPDILPPGSVRINEVWINGSKHADFDAEALTIQLPANHGELKIRVRLVPASTTFSADVVEVSEQTAKLVLTGSLQKDDLKYLQEQIENVLGGKVERLVLVVDALDAISSEALRYLAFTKQKLGADFNIEFEGANDKVKEEIEQSELSEEFAFA